jgi:cytochrome c oxidase subunit 2
MKKRVLLSTLLFGAFTVLSVVNLHAWGESAARRIEVSARRYSFDPAEITLKMGQPVVLVVRSADVAHGIRFRDLNVEITVRAHNKAEVQFTPQKTGDFVGHCSVFCGSGHGSMTLKLHVVD